MTENRLSLSGEPCETLDSLVDALPDGELASPLRSTVPLIAYWDRPEARLAQLTELIGVPCPADPHFHFEFPVPVRRGTGKPSFTDLMVLGDGQVIGIEAKYLEPPYESVSTWLGDPPQPNRREVLLGWLEMIGAVTGETLEIEQVHDVTYQLVHRVASACAGDAFDRSVVYLVFSEDHRGYYEDQIRKFRGLLGTGGELKLFLVFVPFSGSKTYNELVSRWGSGERSLAAEVRPLLQERQDFTFAAPLVADL